MAALAIVGAVSVAGLLAFSFEHAATRAAALTIQFGAYLLLVAYLMTVVAALRWTWRTSRRPVPLTVLTAGIGVLGYVLYRTFRPFPAPPFNWVVLAAVLAAAAGVLVLLAARTRRPGCAVPSCSPSPRPACALTAAADGD